MIEVTLGQNGYPIESAGALLGAENGAVALSFPSLNIGQEVVILLKKIPDIAMFVLNLKHRSRDFN